MISIRISIENASKLVWGSSGPNLNDFYSNFNWKWKEIGLGQLRAESDWFLLRMQGNWSGTAQDRICLISIQILIENERKLVWGSSGPNLNDLYSNFSWKWKEIGLGQPRTESDWILFKFQLKLNGNWSGTAWDRISLISIHISIENKRKLVWDSPAPHLFDFYSRLNSKWKEIGLGQPRTESNWFWFKS